MTALMVTGGAGFIGANFVRHWQARHPDDAVVVLDALTYAGHRASLEGTQSLSFIHGDIADQALVEDALREFDVGVIVHFAAETHVDRSILGADAFVDTNIVGAHALLKAARRVWLDGERPHRFHHVSTDEVYGSLGADEPAFTEGSAYAPNSPYAASKAASDHLVRAYGVTFGLQTTTSHCSNNYGPYQYPEKLIPLFLINALHGRPLPIYGDGLQVRDWLHVLDHCRAIELILERAAPGERYNVGGGAEMTNLALIDHLCRAIDEAFADDPSLAERFPEAPPAHGRPTAELKQHVADRPGHDRRYAIDETRLRADLGYAPQYDFAAGLAQTVRWYLANEAWWRGVMKAPYAEWLARNYDGRKGAATPP